MARVRGCLTRCLTGDVMGSEQTAAEEICDWQCDVFNILAAKIKKAIKTLSVFHEINNTGPSRAAIADCCRA